MLNNVLFILLGAGLVTIGFLAAAFAERIRGSRAMEAPERSDALSQERRVSCSPSAETPSPREITSDPTEMPRTPTVTRAARAPRQSASSPGDDVIAALMAAGYKRTIAAEATWACGEAERATIENWTASALRRCGRGLS